MKHTKRSVVVLLVVLLMSIIVSSASAAVVNVKPYSSSFKAGEISATFSQGPATGNLNDYNCGYYTALKVDAGKTVYVSISMSCQEQQSNGTFMTCSTSTFSNSLDNSTGTTVRTVPANANKVAVVCNSPDMDVVNGKVYRYRLVVSAPNTCSGRYWGIMSSNTSIHGTQTNMP